MLAGATLGVPLGALVNRTQPWVENWYFWEAGALVGAVCGYMVVRKPSDNSSRILPLFTVFGAILGTAIQHQKWNRSLEGAFAGFILAVAVIIIRRAAAAHRSMHQPQA